VDKSEINFAVLYRWRLHAGAETNFTDAWADVTLRLKALGGRGSRLHRAEDGTFWAYAQWPSAKVREEAFLEPVSLPSGNRMADSIAERFEEIRLEVIADLLD
jgi:hypothetical protein